MHDESSALEIHYTMIAPDGSRHLVYSGSSWEGLRAAKEAWLASHYPDGGYRHTT